MTDEQMWHFVIDGSQELADELGLDEPPPSFAPARALGAVDDWLALRGEALDEEDTARLGCLLARVLMEAHDGGLSRIDERGHPLAGEWTITSFRRGLAADYQVPVFVSAWRIGVDRSLGAREWYAQLLAEGR